MAGKIEQDICSRCKDKVTKLRYDDAGNVVCLNCFRYGEDNPVRSALPTPRERREARQDENYSARLRDGFEMMGDDYEN